MITIHSSSLAAHFHGFIQPDPAALSKKPAPSAAVNDQVNIGQTPSVSTPEQIRTTIAQTGPIKEANLSQDTHKRTNEALQAYNQIRNHPVRAQLENLIVRVDYYV